MEQKTDVLKKMTVSVEVGVTQEAIEIVYGLSIGLRPKDIAEKLELSNRTVEARIDLLRKDYKCHTPAHLVGVFIRNKIIN